MLAVRPFWQQVLIGAILIIAVYSDQLKRQDSLAGKAKKEAKGGSAGIV
jgi:ribose/xylose/arabinose/galactoside ABC-type transport system permease subunit